MAVWMEVRQKLSICILPKNPNSALNLEDRELTVDKSDAIAADDGPGWSAKAPGFVDRISVTQKGVAPPAEKSPRDRQGLRQRKLALSRGRTRGASLR
jgi:hypothetical protein